MKCRWISHNNSFAVQSSDETETVHPNNIFTTCSKAKQNAKFGLKSCIKVSNILYFSLGKQLVGGLSTTAIIKSFVITRLLMLDCKLPISSPPPPPVIAFMTGGKNLRTEIYSWRYDCDFI